MTKAPEGMAGLRGCSKPGCRLAAPINRHHIRHEAMWLSIWRRRRWNEPAFRALVKRYHEFHEDDICRICESHHAEIHMIYDRIIAEDRARVGKPLYQYSWRQAKLLMDKLEEAFDLWLRVDTGGIDSSLYERNKVMWRGLMKKSAPKRKRRKHR